MSGPIVRSGPSPQFSKNWDNIFGKQGKQPAKPAKGKKAAITAKKKSPAKKKGRK